MMAALAIVLAAPVSAQQAGWRYPGFGSLE
jgi:hypothetical protein